MRPVLSAILLLFTVAASGQAPRRYIVEFRPGLRAAALTELRGEPRFRVRREFARVLSGAAIELADGAQVDDIAKLPYVERITPDAIVSAYGDAVAGPRAMSTRPRTHGGEGIVVAIIDTGIDEHHPALAGKVLGGYDFVNGDDDPMDDHHHGTHVAGIIAASSATMNGVAPGVSLLAYKVLDSHGNGETSAIVAGIDRAVLDGADVINLSLGVGGHPDDPLSRAVDAATAAGVVVVVAAGNAESFHAIGSPGVAATAITVGATETDTTLADFSSRGPANRSGAIKPEVLAPGVGILSTVLNGAFARSSGTSMAAPYVAGVAALLRAAHPEWTPARVKAALVNTALPLPNEEVMAQGSGRIDATRALASEIVASPAQINFGLDGNVERMWTSTRTLSLRNDGATARTIHLRSESALAIRIAPSEVTLAPGEAREIEVAIDVDHDVLGKPQTPSLSFGGRMVIEWNGGEVRVPFAFIRAARAVVTYPGARPLVGWSVGERYASFALEQNGVEALLEPGVYDMIAMAERDEDVRIFVSEARMVTGEVLLPLTEADAPHAITLAGVDKLGMPLASPAVRARFVMPGASIVLPPFGRTLHASSFSSKYAVLAIESAFDGEALTVVQHEPMRGIVGDVTLRNDPSEFAEDEVRLRFADAQQRSILILPRDWPRRENDYGPMPASFTATTNASTWTLRLRMTPEGVGDEKGDHVGGVQMSAFRGEALPGLADVITPMIRRDADGFFAAWDFERPPSADTSLDYGLGALHAVADLTSTASAFGGTVQIRGEGTEVRRDVPTSYRITDANGAEVAKGDVLGSMLAPLPGAGRYRAELRAGASVMKLEFMTGTVIPSLRSMVVDQDAITFSSDAAPRVFFRRRGASTWVELSTSSMGDDVYRVDLADAVRITRDVELSIEMVDANGNGMAWTTPVLIPAAKRRAVRR